MARITPDRALNPTERGSASKAGSKALENRMEIENQQRQRNPNLEAINKSQGKELRPAAKGEPIPKKRGSTANNEPEEKSR